MDISLPLEIAAGSDPESDRWELPAQPRTRLRRARVACRRCRRLRSRCAHNNATAPCDGCRQAGEAIATACSFPSRGEIDYDRECRRKRLHRNERSRSKPTEKDAPVQSIDTSPEVNHSIPVQRAEAPILTPTISPSRGSPAATPDLWELLPPFEEVVEGCQAFWTSSFQVGFLPKLLFLERLARERESVSVFLLLGILSISARFTPSLTRRYGGTIEATELFMARAGALVYEEQYSPSLETMQGFFLLSVAEWGKGDQIRSSIHMGIAISMARILRLHREETYSLPPNATADEVVKAEIARRSFWVMESQENLHSGHGAPVSFSGSDITALLPCDENEFAFGRLPRERAALAGTQAAFDHPSLTSLPLRSLFATLIQSQALWGKVARRACQSDLSTSTVKPWDSDSDFARMSKTLRDWEDGMPDVHRWSIWNLRGYKAESLHLAYLSIVMTIRLNNIVIRRIYLEDILASFGHSGSDAAPAGFWQNLSKDLFTNVCGLLEPIDTFFSLRSQHEGSPAIHLFCVYICGFLSSHLVKWPELCPGLAFKGQAMLTRCIEILTELQVYWPRASQWLNALKRSAGPTQPDDDQASRAIVIQEGVSNDPAGIYNMQETSQSVGSTFEQQSGRPEYHHDFNGNASALGEAAGTIAESYMEGGHDYHFPDAEVLFPLLDDGFDTELRAYISGEVH